MDFFASDLHFGHRRMIRDRYRPFDSMEEHDEHLIAVWNDRVGKGDRVFVIGDFSFHDPNRTSDILHRLNGQKTLIVGNHDHSRDVGRTTGWQRVMHRFDQKLDTKLGPRYFFLEHFPVLSWHRVHYGAIHLHGHSHGSLRYPEELKRARILDVGVDHLNKLFGSFAPIDIDTVADLMELRGPVSLDHHEIRDEQAV